METDVASRKLFIGGLSYGTDDDKLKSYFEQYGAVQDAVVMKDPVTRRSRGFGFITYTHTAYVDQALAIGIHVIDSRKVEAKRAVPRHEVARDLVSSKQMHTLNSNAAAASASSSSSSSQMNSNGNYYATNSHHYHNENHIHNDEFPSYCKIFVGGLHYDTRDGEFRHYFEKYGKVISAEVMFNRETHKSRGFGFIIFDNEASVDQVCEEREHIIDGKTVEVKRAVPRSKIGMVGPDSPLSQSSTVVAPSSAQKNNFKPSNPLSIPSSASSSSTSSNPQPSGQTAGGGPTPSTPKGLGNNSSFQSNQSAQSTQKSTPDTPPTTYAAAVIAGPSGHSHKPPSQQNSPQVQSITSSPSLGPIGSPTSSSLSSSNPNVSFGMMLPPLHASITNSNNPNYGSGSNSLNGSTHGSASSSPYHPPQSQSLFNQTTESQMKKLAAPTPHLLQHQEQFPLPHSPLRSVTSNYSLPEHPHTQFPQYPSPNSLNPSRSRAYTESFLFITQKSSLPFPLHHLTFSPSPDLPYPPLLPSNLDTNLDEPIRQQHSDSSLNDEIHSTSSWSPTSKQSTVSSTAATAASSVAANRESQLENLFVSRQDIERSVSLGGLGWMPSSLSNDTHITESRRGFSDLGIGIGFGSGGSIGHESNFSFDYNSPNSHHQQHHQHQQQQQQPSPPFVPSMSAWESFIDHSLTNSNQTSSISHSSPARPHSYSLNHLHDGFSPKSRHPPSPMGSASLQNSTSSNLGYSNHGHGGVEDDNSYHIQELRLQAPEFTPNNSQSSPSWMTR